MVINNHIYIININSLIHSGKMMSNYDEKISNRCFVLSLDLKLGFDI